MKIEYVNINIFNFCACNDWNTAVNSIKMYQLVINHILNF
jgi:hypothetical protein